MLCCRYTLTDFPISIRLTSLALWQSNHCPSAGKATLMNMDKYFMWIHYERLHNHSIAKHNKTVCIFLGIYCKCHSYFDVLVQERHNSIANALELRLSCTHPSILYINDESSFHPGPVTLDKLSVMLSKTPKIYRKVSYIRRTLVGNKIVDHSDVVGASPVGAAPTTSSFST